MEWDLHESIVFHGCVEVEVRDVCCDHAGIWGGDGAVKETLGSHEVSSVGAVIARVLYEVAPYCMQTQLGSAFCDQTSQMKQA